MTKRIFISDLHLEDPNSAAFLRFSELLAEEATRVDELFILGDLVEMWIGDDDDAEVAGKLSNLLGETTKKCGVYLMHGNRDFLFGDRFASDTGVRIVNDPYLTDDGLLLTHGDAYCTDDEAYQTMRTMFRSAAWQSEILSKSLTERKALGQMLRSLSKGENANKPANIMDVNRQAINAILAEHDTHLLIHGHTHRPGTHRSESHSRYVLGAWERCGWLVRQCETQIELECFPLNRPYAGRPL